MVPDANNGCGEDYAKNRGENEKETGWETKGREKRFG